MVVSGSLLSRSPSWKQFSVLFQIPFQEYFARTIDCPALKRRSFENVGRPAKDFEDKCEEGKRVEVRTALETLKEAGTDSALAIYKMAKVKADDEGQKDAAFVLSQIYDDPIGNGANIRAAMKASENEGKIVAYFFDIFFRAKIVTAVFTNATEQNTSCFDTF